mmetsp:Transcript_142322/g.370763  ORF Transcript_142322/g.370763 Transcript_142322/m.370763 type:complete len:213 (+) Transcript_142322:157-795(+)
MELALEILDRARRAELPAVALVDLPGFHLRALDFGGQETWRRREAVVIVAHYGSAFLGCLVRLVQATLPLGGPWLVVDVSPRTKGLTVFRASLAPLDPVLVGLHHRLVELLRDQLCQIEVEIQRQDRIDFYPGRRELRIDEVPHLHVEGPRPPLVVALEELGVAIGLRGVDVVVPTVTCALHVCHPHQVQPPLGRLGKGICARVQERFLLEQ